MVERITPGGGSAAAVITATPGTSDGGGWLLVNTRATLPPANARTCAEFPTPCGIDVLVLPPGLAGEYTGVVTVSDGVRSGFVVVKVLVDPPPDTNPVVTTGGPVSVSAPLGSRQPVLRTVLIGSSSAGTPFTLTQEQDWLDVFADEAILPTILQLSFDPSDLGPGTYTDTILIQHRDTRALLAFLPVTFHITSPKFLTDLRYGMGWQTLLYLVNPDSVENTVDVRFWRSTGPDSALKAQPWTLSLADRGDTSEIRSERIPAGGIRVIEASGNLAVGSQGWAEVTGAGPIETFAVLRRTAGAGGRLPAADTIVPLDRALAQTLLVPFDNRDDAVTTVAIANAADTAARVAVTIRNTDGAVSSTGSDLSLEPNGHTILTLGTAAGGFADTINKSGSLELASVTGRLIATGIRLRKGQLTTFPAVPRGGLGTARGLPLAAFGGGWDTTIRLINPAATSQPGALRFWQKTAGEPLAAPIPGFDTPREALSPTLDPGGVFTLAIASGARDASRGWMESTHGRAVAGMAALRQAQDGDAPLLMDFESMETAAAVLSSRVGVLFDNRDPARTQATVVNIEDREARIQVYVQDLSGRFSPREIGSFRLPALGQATIRVEDLDEGWAGRTGIVEFRSSTGNRLTASAIQSNGNSFVVLPGHGR
jgi:hypothetical protein